MTILCSFRPVIRPRGYATTTRTYQHETTEQEFAAKMLPLGKTTAIGAPTISRRIRVPRRPADHDHRPRTPDPLLAGHPDRGERNHLAGPDNPLTFAMPLTTPTIRSAYAGSSRARMRSASQPVCANSTPIRSLSVINARRGSRADRRSARIEIRFLQRLRSRIRCGTGSAPTST
jgi:hypothetical protein